MEKLKDKPEDKQELQINEYGEIIGLEEDKKPKRRGRGDTHSFLNLVKHTVNNPKDVIKDSILPRIKGVKAGDNLRKLAEESEKMTPIEFDENGKIKLPEAA